ncbi:MAG TPA: hypothetical protein VNO33_17805 [Kofleriaceae bacterium]|nr:hypothetical protein [Kofleriaceae bacterium]
MRRRSIARAALVLAWAICATGCQQRRIDVVEKSEDRTGDYGRQALRASVEKFRTAPRSPEAYRALAVEIDRLRPAFNQDVADEAERHLASLALGPMAAQIDRSLPDQMAALALTVWPTALRVEPKPGETPRTYLERACAGPLASECKYVVPESWPLVLSAKVWRRMKSRAREAYGECRACKQEPSYAALLEEYDQHESRMTRMVAAEKGRVERDAWPEAGANAAEWSDAPLLDLVPDPPLLAGEPVEGNWRARLRSNRRGTVLAVHLKPRSEVRQLRDALRAAGAAGFRTVALQARQREFPYSLVEYRLATRGGGRPVPASDVDTIQFLVRSLDTAAKNGGGARPLRLSAR